MGNQRALAGHFDGVVKLAGAVQVGEHIHTCNGERQILPDPTAVDRETVRRDAAADGAAFEMQRDDGAHDEGGMPGHGDVQVAFGHFRVEHIAGRWRLAGHRRRQRSLEVADVNGHCVRPWPFDTVVDQVVKLRPTALQLGDVAIGAVGDLEIDVAQACPLTVFSVVRPPVGVSPLNHQSDAVIGVLPYIGENLHEYGIDSGLQYPADSVDYQGSRQAGIDRGADDR